MEKFDITKRRSREELRELVRDLWLNTRVWIQEHGEKSSIIAFLLGIIVVLAPILIYSIAVLVVILALLVYFLSDSSCEAKSPERCKEE